MMPSPLIPGAEVFSKHLFLSTFDESNRAQILLSLLDEKMNNSIATGSRFMFADLLMEMNHLGFTTDEVNGALTVLSRPPDFTGFSTVGTFFEKNAKRG
jgi:hypothetical protein